LDGVAGERVAEHRDVEVSVPDNPHRLLVVAGNCHIESTTAQHFRPVKRELMDTAKEEDSAASNPSSRAAPFFGNFRPRILAWPIVNGGISRNVR